MSSLQKGNKRCFRKPLEKQLENTSPYFSETSIINRRGQAYNGESKSQRNLRSLRKANVISQIYQLNKGEFNITKSSIKHIIEHLKTEKAQCEEVVEISEGAIQESLQPQSVWLQEKEKAEKRIREIDKGLKIFENLLKKFE